MANIDQYLDEIEVASRGEEVRDSIIDAFEALNSEGPGTMKWENITDTPDTLTGYGVSEVPASMVSGVLALNNIPPSALERMVPVANDTARFALTSSDVQNGDTVKVLSTQKLYLVVDDTSLSTEAGYEEYRAGTADSVDWSGVLNTPDSLAGYGIEDAYTKDEVDDITTSEEEESDAGNPISIETDASQYAKKTHITLEPVQDLHGYDHPWPAGGGKNLLPYPYYSSSATLNGVTITVNDNGSITLNGTSTANVEFYISNRSYGGPFTPDAGTYILTGCPTGYSNYHMRIGYNRGSDGTTIANDTGSGATITENEGGVRYGMWLAFDSGATFNNLTIYPMVRKSTETDATFAPYSNICPITGVDEVEVRATGKNLVPFDESYEAVGDSLWINLNYFLKAGTYVFTYNPSVTTGAITFNCYDKDGRRIFNNQGIDNRNHQLTFTIEKDCYRISSYSNSSLTISEPMIRLASDIDDTYEPYQGYTASLDLPEPVYGGTLDLETGEVVADMGVTKISDFSWSTQQSSYGKFACVGIPSNIKKDVNSLVAICDAYKGYSDALKPPNVDGIYVSSAGQFKIYDSRYDLSQVNDWATEMADIKIVYLLETPITYQLTPQQLALFKGTNNISTNTKTVQVTYRNGELATTGDIVASTEVAKRSILGEAASDTDAKLATSLAPILGNFATAETSPTSASHAVGEYLLYNKRLYKVLAAISAGQQLTIGTNIGQTSVAAELTRLNSLLT